jgi:hypothetical protein
VLSHTLSRIQIPGLKLADVIGGRCGGTNRTEDGLHVVPNIEAAAVGLRHVALRKKAADVVVRREVEELRPWTPRLGRPVLSAAEARAEPGGLRGTRALRVAARATVRDTPVIIYAAVLPWLAVTSHAPDIVRTGEDSMAAFARVLGEQLRDVMELQQRIGELVVWAGDFNQTLAGPLWGGSATRRAMLAQALASIGYAAWNEDAEHARARMRAIDFICGPADWELAARGRLEPSRDGLVMSDHAGYWVELAR